ncbi:hypothetical protein SDC9_145250 [bioreactor metagenome]|uniref:Uncharacterized protein n=1 Tax=bioreactor metagenome TaxID=1076179 RepID=A0A645E9I7_9ZZZZ
MRTDIAVDDVQRMSSAVAAAVRISQSPRHPRGDENRQLRRQHPVDLAVEFNEIEQRNAVDEFEHEKVFVINFVELINLHQVFVHQVGDQLGFGDEAVDEFPVGSEARQQCLDGDDFFKALNPFEFGFEHRTHAAGGDFLDNIVAGLPHNQFFHDLTFP